MSRPIRAWVCEDVDASGFVLQTGRAFSVYLDARAYAAANKDSTRAPRPMREYEIDHYCAEWMRAPGIRGRTAHYDHAYDVDADASGVDADGDCIRCGFPADNSSGHGTCDARCHSGVRGVQS